MQREREQQLRERARTGSRRTRHTRRLRGRAGRHSPLRMARRGLLNRNRSLSHNRRKSNSNNTRADGEWARAWIQGAVPHVLRPSARGVAAPPAYVFVWAQGIEWECENRGDVGVARRVRDVGACDGRVGDGAGNNASNVNSSTSCSNSGSRKHKHSRIRPRRRPPWCRR
ncbi:hypothetical protein B0H16DRAFT_629616 [Mycena metata]|uniref:Uncharacterized protein n=1 Tax=Mycena metata TaxID=1033252 RepID=A0AAD7NFW3_9AGAR|nr:hypothetical protein B0H16DRAFT_629616 [Mycena metata]